MFKINKHHQRLQHFYTTTTSCKIRSFRGSRPEAATSQVVGAISTHQAWHALSVPGNRRRWMWRQQKTFNLNLSRSQSLFAQNVHLHSLVTRRQAVSGVAVWTCSKCLCCHKKVGSLAPGSHTEWSWKPSIGAGELNLCRQSPRRVCVVFHLKVESRSFWENPTYSGVMCLIFVYCFLWVFVCRLLWKFRDFIMSSNGVVDVMEDPGYNRFVWRPKSVATKTSCAWISEIGETLSNHSFRWCRFMFCVFFSDFWSS